MSGFEFSGIVFTVQCAEGTQNKYGQYEMEDVILYDLYHNIVEYQSAVHW